MSFEGADAGAAFTARAASRLRREPPRLDEPRSDLRGDHSLDPHGWPGRGGGQPRIAAVLIPVVFHPDGPAVLLTQRAAGLRQHSGQIAFPGGKMDPDDPSLIATALREAEEEIGLDPGLVSPLGFLDAYLSGTNYFVVPVVAGVEPGFVPTPNPDEVESVFETPLAFLMSEANHEMHAREWQGRVRSYYAIPYGRRYIWGVTAGIIRNMHERLYDS